jgi:hypothetical protein
MKVEDGKNSSLKNAQEQGERFTVPFCLQRKFSVQCSINHNFIRLEEIMKSESRLQAKKGDLNPNH